MSKTYELPAEIRENLSNYIQANPSPNITVRDVLKLVMQLQNLKLIGETKSVPTLVPNNSDAEDGPVIPGGSKENGIEGS